ncbi:MAG: aminoacetone oxidase family FAD-binding enzyme [Ruminococcus sp.]|nr:aminoacetone oxidase family FAD-binding enzyme [Ruminococcus sp.]
MYKDIIIIGGGASGLAAAVSAKKTAPELSVTVLERCDRVGKKLLATGNGRCNLSNRDISPEKYHGSVDAVKIIRAELSGEEMFGLMGVMTYADSQGRVYPHSESAATILNALRQRCEELGVELLCGADYNVTSIQPGDRGAVVSCKAGALSCAGLITAAGGYASPQHGTDGTVIKLLRDLGYKTAKICPAVAPLKTDPSLLKGLKGVRLKGRISAVSGDQLLRTEEGEIQFTESTVSGICVFDLAYLYQQYEGRLTLRADLLPEMTLGQLTDYLFSMRKRKSSLPLEELATGLFAKNPAVYLVKRAIGRPMTEAISTVTDKELRSLASLIKKAEFPVTGCAPWQSAQATCGGIHGSCIDGELRSRLHRSVFLCGEAVDVVGDCGGYNLQWAWSSGTAAGRNCASQVKGGAK